MSSEPFPLSTGQMFGPKTLNQRRWVHDHQGVERVQEALSLPLTGKWDQETGEAVRAFQRGRKRLRETGLVDRATWKALPARSTTRPAPASSTTEQD